MGLGHLGFMHIFLNQNRRNCINFQYHLKMSYYSFYNRNIAASNLEKAVQTAAMEQGCLSWYMSMTDFAYS